MQELTLFGKKINAQESLETEKSMVLHFRTAKGLMDWPTLDEETLL